jgi:hypothetical protein
VLKFKLLVDLSPSTATRPNGSTSGSTSWPSSSWPSPAPTTARRVRRPRGLGPRAHRTDFDTSTGAAFQQEYRDYIDLPKLAQMIPIVGAPIGAVVNWRLVERLGETAMNGYRMRWLARS